MLEELSSDGAATADAATVADRPRMSVTDSLPVVHAWPAIDAQAAMAALDTAGDRAALADALMSYATSLFDVGALLFVRDALGFGWKAFGSEGVAQRIELALVPLDAPSVFKQAMASEEGQFHGAPPPSAVTGFWCNKILRSRDPVAVTVQVIAIGKRPVNLLYGHRLGKDGPSERELAELAAVSDRAAEAYARLIAGAKGRPDGG